MKTIKNISMTKQIVIATILGILLGIIFKDKISGIKIIGDIFLRLVTMSVVLLIMGAVIEAVGELDYYVLGKLGVKVAFWFTFTTCIAASLGIALGTIFTPGKIGGISVGFSPVKALDKSIYNIVLDFFPNNIISSMANANMVQVMIFSILFGIALSIWRTNHDTCYSLSLLKEFNEIITKMVTIIMQLAPLGICSLMAYTTGNIGFKVVIPLIKFLLIFAAGSCIHLIIVIVFVAFYCRVSPVVVAKRLTRMTLFAMTTTSSAVTFPVQLEDTEKKLGVSKKMSRIVVTLGMTLDSNGLAMYLALACIMIAQFYGIEISVINMTKIVVVSTLTCLGTVVVPGGGLVALAMVVPSLGLPIESIALLSGIDWFSGIFRTVLNVDVDALIAMIIAKDENELNYEILNGNS